MTDQIATCDSDGTCLAALRQRIGQARECLVHQGSLVLNRRGDKTYWRLRYYEYHAGGRTQRTIYVGSARNVPYVETLLAELRAPEAYQRQTMSLVKLIQRAVRPVLRKRRGRKP